MNSNVLNSKADSRGNFHSIQVMLGLHQQDLGAIGAESSLMEDLKRQMIGIKPEDQQRQP